MLLLYNALGKYFGETGKITTTIPLTSILVGAGMPFQQYHESSFATE